MRTIATGHKCGFTIIELAAILVVVVGLAVLLVPALARNRVNSKRVQCVSNLRQVAIAELGWASDGRDTPHWLTPLADAGTQGHAQAHHAWFQWSWISNRLGSPRVLVCPADKAAKVASDWTEAPAGGFLNPKFRDAALSYFLNISGGNQLHFPVPTATLERMSGPVFTGDYTVRVDGPTQPCGQHTGLSYVCVSSLRPCRWVPPPHQPKGNIVLLDGSYASVGNDGLSFMMTNFPNLGDASAHLLVPERPAPR